MMLCKFGLMTRSILVLVMAFPMQSALAQEPASSYPSKPIRFISSGVAGGLTDVVSRVVADRMNSSGDLRGQQVLVENKPGAAGIIASVFVAKSLADGYTVAIADLTQTAIVPAL